MKLFGCLSRQVVAAPPPKADAPLSCASGRQEMASGMALFGPSPRSPSSPGRPKMSSESVQGRPRAPGDQSIPERLDRVVANLKSCVHAQGNRQAHHWAMGQDGEGSLVTNLVRMKIVEFARAHVGVDYTKIIMPDKKLASTLAAEIMQRSAIVPSERKAMRKELTAQLQRDLSDVQSTPKLSGETSIEAFTRRVEGWDGPVGWPESQLPALPPISENVLKALQAMSGDADFLASVKLPGVIEGLRNGVRANGLAMDLVHCKLAEHLLANFGQTVHFPAADEFVAGLTQTMPELDARQRDELKACYQIALDQVLAITTAAGGKPAIEPIIDLMSRWAVDANLPPPPGMTWRSGAGGAHGSGSSGRSPDAHVAPPGRLMSRNGDGEEHKSDDSRSPSPVNRQPRLD